MPTPAKTRTKGCNESTSEYPPQWPLSRPKPPPHTYCSIILAHDRASLEPRFRRPPPRPPETSPSGSLGTWLHEAFDSELSFGLGLGAGLRRAQTRPRSASRVWRWGELDVALWMPRSCSCLESQFLPYHHRTFKVEHRAELTRTRRRKSRWQLRKRAGLAWACF